MDAAIIVICLLGSLAGAALVGNMLALLGYVPPYIILTLFVNPSTAGLINILLLIPLFNSTRKTNTSFKQKSDNEGNHFDSNIIIVKCPNCLQKNRIKTNNLVTSRCGSCKNSFNELAKFF